jgi:hypothetical protein
VLHVVQHLTGTTAEQRTRLPAKIFAEQSRTINARMCPKVTERRQPAEWPLVKQCLLMTALLN